MSDIPRQYGVGMACFDPEIGRRIRVKVDGRPVSMVIAYDLDAGQVLRCKTDAEGQPVLDVERDVIERELLTGTVTATLDD